MVIDAFCPDLNIQAALSFMATMWMVSLTRVNSDGVAEYYYVPLSSEQDTSGCEMILQAYPSVLDGKALYITMTTKYNESFVEYSNFTLNSSMLYRSSNVPLVHQLISDSTSSMQILPCKGDPVYIPSSHQQTKDFVILLDDNTQEQSVYLIGMNESATIYVYINTNSSSSGDLQMVDSMQLNHYDPVLLNSSYARDGTRLQSNSLFGVVIVSNVNNTQSDSSTDITWESLPSSSHMGTEFCIIPPFNESIFLCKILGTQAGNITIQSVSNSKLHVIKPYASLTFNFTGETEVIISSSAPVQTLCTTWVHQPIVGTNINYKNQFFAVPVEQASFCSVLIISNCVNETCVLAFSDTNSEILEIRLYGEQKSNELLAPLRTAVIGNRSVNVWEIGNLTDGVYVLSTLDNAFIMPYMLDVSNGRYFPVHPCPETMCNTSLQSWTINTNMTASDVDSLNAESMSSTISQTTDSIITNATGATSKDTSNNSSSTSKSVTISTPSAVNHVVVSKYSFMYDEIPEDDRILNEYMIAVIVSLGTAIFAVVAVLSTFLLLEVLARRRQLGNSKIRPMVS